MHLIIASNETQVKYIHASKFLGFPKVESAIFQIRYLKKVTYFRVSVAGSVIQATGTVEFEDGLRTGILPAGDC